MNLQRSTTLVTLLTALAAAASMTACNRNDEGRSAVQEAERKMAQVPQRAEEIKSDARAAAEQAREATAGAMDTMASKAKDAAITTSVNAALAKDPQLSALRIDVDTVEGRVALRGTAPDAATRDRATELASRVDGVRSVENQLTVNPKG
jgi:hyperosmotically inducible protein